MTTINEYAKQIGEWGKRKGWDMSKARAKGERRRDFVLGKLMLVVTEVSEAAECVRDDDFDMRGGKPFRRKAYFERTRTRAPRYGHVEGITKPEGMITELADAVIRIMHLCDAMRLDLDAAIATKMAFNETRKHKHGRKA